MGVDVKDFSANILGQTVHFHVISMQQSFFLWMGTRASMKSLAVAMQTRFSEQPISTQLLGDATDVVSNSLAKKLAKKTNCQCFVSSNIGDPSLYLATEQHLIKLIEKDPTTFFS